MFLYLFHTMFKIFDIHVLELYIVINVLKNQYEKNQLIKLIILQSKIKMQM
jgi:hypothetical protein